MRLKDIASELGISVSTVSRTLNHPELNAAGPELTRRILEIAARGNYSPDPIARRLQSPQDIPQEENLYVLIARPPAEVRNDPFYYIISSSIASEAALCRREIRCTYSVPDTGMHGLLADFVPEAPGDVIILGRFPISLLPRLRSLFRHIVYVGLNRIPDDCDQVICDGYEAMQDAISHLYQMGHELVGFIGAEPEEHRYRGFMRGAELLGLPREHVSMVSTAPLSMDSGYHGMLRLLAQASRPTGVVCANDMVAIGALQACRDNGLRVPEDISLIGMDDIPSIRYVEPKLTTIHVPMEEMGRMAVRILQDRIRNSRTVPCRLMLPYSILEQESCRALT